MDIAQIYEKYGQMVYKYLFCLCKDEHMAQDLTQETFCKAIQSVHRFKGSCKVSTWLCQIAKHLWYQELEKQKRRKTTQIEEIDVFPDEQSLENAMILKLEKLELYKRIHTLNDTEKEVVLFRITGELSFKEIGEILGKSENWARVTFYRAKHKLTEVTNI